MKKRFITSIVLVIITAIVGWGASALLNHMQEKRAAEKITKDAAIVRSRHVLEACNDRLAKTRRLIGFFSGKWDGLKSRITAEDKKAFSAIKSEYREMITAWNTRHAVLSFNMSLSFPGEINRAFEKITKRFESLNNSQIESRLLRGTIEQVLAGNDQLELRSLLTTLNEIEGMVKGLNQSMIESIRHHRIY